MVNQDGEGTRDVGVRGGRIAAIGNLAAASAGATIDAAGLHVLPGVIDTQVHFREPGLTQKEDLETGSRSAVLGGVTAVFEMPNTNPLTVTAEALADKIARGHHRMHCDFAFYVGGTRENTKDLAELERLPGCCGVKVFMGSSTGSLLVEDDDGVRSVARPSAAARLPFRGRVPPARAQGRAHRERSALAPGVARRDHGAAMHAASGRLGARDRQAHPCAAYHHRAGDGVSERP